VGHDASGGDAPVLNSKTVQCLAYKVGRFKLLEREFGMTVDMTSRFDHPWIDRIDVFSNGHRQHLRAVQWFQYGRLGQRS
jgi:hypothetical protein